MSFITILLFLSLASYRLGRLASQEDGPMDLASRWRQTVGQKTWIGRGFHCCLCCSFWIACLGALYLVGIKTIDWQAFPVVWFATAGGAAVIYQVVR